MAKKILGQKLKWLLSFTELASRCNGKSCSCSGTNNYENPNEFGMITKKGAMGLGTFDLPEWHKREGEHILQEAGLDTTLIIAGIVVVIVIVAVIYARSQS